MNNYKFAKVLIIRGIGYRAFYINSDLSAEDAGLISSDQAGFNAEQFFAKENGSSRFLVIRAGHTKDLCVAIPANIWIKTGKKDRKLVIYGQNASLVATLAWKIYKYRTPSVYTGRGVRRKGVRVIRKAGKKDKQKGRGF